MGKAITGNGVIYPPEEYVVQNNAHIGPEQSQTLDNISVHVHRSFFAIICKIQRTLDVYNSTNIVS